MSNQVQQLIDNFYNKDVTFSYSSINRLLYSPVSYFDYYILKNREESIHSHLVEGKAIHCMLLDKEVFMKQFVVMPEAYPSIGIKKIVENIFFSYLKQEDKSLVFSDFKSDILTHLVSINLHQKLKTDEQRLDKVINDETSNYFDWLKTSFGKDLISLESFNRCIDAVKIIKANDKACNLLRCNNDYNTSEFIEVLNEIELECSLSKYKFKLKGIIDNLVIDYANKKILINDLKTTSKSLSNFTDSIEHWNYWLQAAIYTRLVKNFIVKEKNITDISDWTLTFHFIVIDKYNQVYSFPVRNTTMLYWQKRLDEVLVKTNYHYESRDYTLPFEFAKDKVML